MSKRFHLFCVIFYLIPLLVFAQTFSGKCVGVTDGDTINVLKDGKEIQIRLDGIDCPEKGQDFGSKAKRFTSNLVFGKNVEIYQKDIDKYGRTVARIIVNGKDVSLELVKAGLAWHYKEYSSDPELAKAENLARDNEDGLWGMTNPVAPWDFRHGNTSYSTTQAAQSSQTTEIPTSEAQDVIVYLTMTDKKYHKANCKYLDSYGAAISLEKAIGSGFTPCSECFQDDK